MSITTVTRSKDAVAAATYVLYGSKSGPGEGVDGSRALRAAQASVIGPRPGFDLDSFGGDTRALIRKHPSRVNQVVSIVQSFSPDELDKTSAADVEMAHHAGCRLAEIVAPHSPALIATHTDSKSGAVHNHILLANHDFATGKTPRIAGNWHSVREENDKLMKDLGLQVLERGSKELSRAERFAKAQGRQIDAAGLELQDLTGDTWRSFMRARVEDLFQDDRVRSAQGVKAGLKVANEIAGEHNLAFGIRENSSSKAKEKYTTMYALKDDDGEFFKYPTKRGKRKASTTGSRLGSDYEIKPVMDYIHQLQQRYQMEEVVRQRALEKERIRQQRQAEFDAEFEDYDAHNKPARVSPPPVAPPIHDPAEERIRNLTIDQFRKPKRYGSRPRVQEEEFGPEF